jgi:hypothetical protein
MFATIQAKTFSSAVKKCENENIEDYNFACGFVWA